jgi:hypothetical protein
MHPVCPTAPLVQAARRHAGPQTAVCHCFQATHQAQVHVDFEGLVRLSVLRRRLLYLQIVDLLHCDGRQALLCDCRL